MNGKNFDTSWQSIQQSCVKDELTLLNVEEPGVTEGDDDKRTQDKATGTHRVGYTDLVCNRILRRTTYIVCYMWTVNSMTYYGLALFSSQLSGDIYVNYMLGALLEIPANVLLWIMCSRVGRKKTCIFFHLLGGLCLSATVLSSALAGRDIDHVCNVSETLANVSPKDCGIYLVNTSGEDGFVEPCNNGYIYAEPRDKSYISEWDLVCDREPLGRLATTLIMAGMLFGAILLPPVGDLYGRKLLHVASHVLLFASSLAMAFVNNLTGFFIIKFLFGFLIQGVANSQVVLALELFPTSHRTVIGFLISVAWSLSFISIVPIAYLTRDSGWRVTQIVLAAFMSYSILEIWLLDESLRWLVANNKVKKVVATVKKAAKMNGKRFEDVWQTIQTERIKSMVPATDTNRQEGSQEYKDVDDAFLTQENKPKEKRMTILDLVTNKTLRYTTYIICYIWIINSMTYYGLTYLSSRLAGSTYVNFALAGVLEIPSCLVMFFLFKRVGRKNACIFFHLVAGVSLLIAVLVTALAGDTQAAATCQTVFSLIGRCAITGSYNAIWLYTPEVYPTNCRSIALGLASSVARIGSMASPFLKSLADVAVWAPGAIFAVACITVIGLILLLPETKDKELPQTVEEFQRIKEANPSPKKSKASVNKQSK